MQELLYQALSARCTSQGCKVGSFSDMY